MPFPSVFSFWLRAWSCPKVFTIWTVVNSILTPPILLILLPTVYTRKHFNWFYFGYSLVWFLLGCSLFKNFGDRHLIPGFLVLYWIFKVRLYALCLFLHHVYNDCKCLTFINLFIYSIRTTQQFTAFVDRRVA